MRPEHVIGGAALLSLVMSCGGSSGGTPSPPPQPPPFTSVKQVQVSQPPTFGTCNGVAQQGTLYDKTAVEPSLVVNPANSVNLIAAWQQERWDNGGAQAVNLGVSFDGGTSWQIRNAAFSVCTGGNVNNGGNYLRASDPWVTASPTGLIYALTLSFTGGALLAGSSNAQLVARSIDGGNTWGVTTPLMRDGASFFNDKGSITADPTNASYVYAVWDRMDGQTNGGPSWFAFTQDGGNSWQAARNIYDPGPNNQTLGNIIVVLPTGVLVNVFTELDTSADGKITAELRAIRSTDRGANWSTPPVTIAEEQAVGASDPLTSTPIRDSSDLFSVATSVSGVIYVAWQDARFSSGQHDGIALASSTDGGLTWSTPVQVNADAKAVAFTPTINVRSDGVIAITYYDLRNDTFAGMVLTDCWMVSSSDGKTFKEAHLAGPFNLNNAPRSEIDANNTLGLFLGDYQALASTSMQFLPFFAQTNPGTAVSSDVFVNFPPAADVAAAAAQPAVAPVAREFHAHEAQPGAVLDETARRRVMDRIRAVQHARWSQGH
ncbi:MAG TPA: sialidase family protein [Steroidobacteraceae bacterium]|nr:sialidase family protein [Steroidobacteraceae bacterium]